MSRGPGGAGRERPDTTALGIARRLGLETDRLDVRPYSGSQQHESWLVSENGRPVCWVKLQRAHTIAGVAREARVLRTVGGHPLVPELLCAGKAPDGRDYLVTSALPGRPLDQVLSEEDRQCIDATIRDCAEWIAGFHSVDMKRVPMPVGRGDIAGAHPDLAALLGPAVGWWDRCDARVAQMLRNTRFCDDDSASARTVHGSFDPRNLLCDADRLSGVVDLEATRPGDPAFDLAGMACELLLAGAGHAAGHWLEASRAHGEPPAARVGGFLALRVWHRALSGADDSHLLPRFADQIAELLTTDC